VRFTVDGTPQGVSTTDGPDSATADRTPTFSFSANEGGASFECRMDSGDFVACSSPFVSDRAGNTEAVASRPFTVEKPAPVAGDDSYATDEDHKLTVGTRSGGLTNDTAPNGPPTAIQISGPSHGTLALAPDGPFVYTPEADYHNPHAFTYQTSDGNKGSGEATVGIEVRPVNDAPGAEDDQAVAERGWPLRRSRCSATTMTSTATGSPSRTSQIPSTVGPQLARTAGSSAMSLIAATPDRTPLPTPSRTSRGDGHRHGGRRRDVVFRDTTAPGILRVRPEDDRKTVSVFAPHPRTVCSEDLDAASAKADGVFVFTLILTLIRKSTGGEVPARVRYEAESRRLALVPEDGLKRGWRYTVRGSRPGPGTSRETRWWRSAGPSP
jgi:hypothetical protein